MTTLCDRPVTQEPATRPQSEACEVGARAQVAITSSCGNCAMRQFCVLNPEDLGQTRQLDDLVLSYRNVKKGDVVYRSGDSFRNVYAVRTGSFKTVTLLADGREQVTGFFLAGEPLGVDGISSGRYASDAVALEDSTVCMMPFDLLELLCREVKAMQHHVHRMLSGEIVRESAIMMLLGTMTADERVATFLVDLSNRWRARGYSALQFVLRMKRDEIASYLGLKLETISRTLTKLQKRGLISVNGREIRILDRDGLTAV